MKLYFKIQKSIEEVYDYLTDMQKFQSIHPIIHRIDALGQEKYLIHERLPLGIFTIPFTYPMTLETNPSENQVKMKATVFGLVKIVLFFTLSTNQNYTFIDEDIKFTSIWPMGFFLKSTFKKHHHRMFKNLSKA
jgi:carbon monoxide dehydrogenase subunit G